MPIPSTTQDILISMFQKHSGLSGPQAKALVLEMDEVRKFSTQVDLDAAIAAGDIPAGDFGYADDTKTLVISDGMGGSTSIGTSSSSEIIFAASTVWSGASVSYSIDDTVTNGGDTYIAIQANTSGAQDAEPGVGAVWQDFWALLTATGNARHVFPGGGLDTLLLPDAAGCSGCSIALSNTGSGIITMKSAGGSILDLGGIAGATFIVVRDSVQKFVSNGTDWRAV